MLRRFLFILLALLFTTIGVFAVFAADDEVEVLPLNYGIGDVNTDSTVNIKDATTIQKHLADIIVLNTYQLKLADVNYDDSVNIKDATFIQKLIAGLVQPMNPPDSQVSITTVETFTTEVHSERTDPVETTAISDVIYPTTSNDFDETIPVISTTTELITDTVETSASVTETQLTTRDPNKPVELPFVPVS